MVASRCGSHSSLSLPWLDMRNSDARPPACSLRSTAYMVSHDGVLLLLVNSNGGVYDTTVADDSLHVSWVVLELLVTRFVLKHTDIIGPGIILSGIVQLSQSRIP